MIPRAPSRRRGCPHSLIKPRLERVPQGLGHAAEDFPCGRLTVTQRPAASGIEFVGGDINGMENELGGVKELVGDCGDAELLTMAGGPEGRSSRAPQ